MILKSIKFFSIFIILYLTICYAYTLNTNSKWNSWKSNSLEQFRDVQSAREVDIVFLGSSFTFRQFSPEVFDAQGFSSFNLGSINQTPLNTYYLLKEYWGQLNPKIIVMEIYPTIFSYSGSESSQDIIVQHPLTLNVLRMALASKRFSLINRYVIESIRRWTDPLEQRENVADAGQGVYIKSGYVEKSDQRSDVHQKPEMIRRLSADPKEVQFKYLQKIIRFVQLKNRKIVLVIHPVPKDIYYAQDFAFKKIRQNYHKVKKRLQVMAEEARIQLIDFNEIPLGLDNQKDFADEFHLNKAGVQKFNKALIEKIYVRRK